MIDGRMCELAMSCAYLKDAFDHLRQYGLDMGDIDAKTILVSIRADIQQEYLAMRYPEIHSVDGSGS